MIVRYDGRDTGVGQPTQNGVTSIDLQEP